MGKNGMTSMREALSSVQVEKTQTPKKATSFHAAFVKTARILLEEETFSMILEAANEQVRRSV